MLCLILVVGAFGVPHVEKAAIDCAWFGQPTPIRRCYARRHHKRRWCVVVRVRP